jgi:hypothetical protein
MTIFRLPRWAYVQRWCQTWGGRSELQTALSWEVCACLCHLGAGTTRHVPARAAVEARSCAVRRVLTGLQQKAAPLDS